MNTDKRSHLIKWIGAFAAAFVLIAGLSFAFGGRAQAAAYRKIPDKVAYDGAVRKIGSYYFKGKLDSASSGYKLYCSKKKYSGYRFMGNAENSYTNGKYVISVSLGGNRLQRRTCATGKVKTLRKLKPVSNSWESGWKVSAVCSSRVYLTREVFLSRVDTYMYKFKGRSFKRVKKGWQIINRKGNYMVLLYGTSGDYSPRRLALYRATSSGVKKIKQLARYGGMNCWFAGKKLYYAAYPSEGMDKVTLYSCSRSGTGRKRIKTFTAQDGENGYYYGEAIITAANTTRCLVLKNGDTYRYTYKTGVMELL